MARVLEYAAVRNHGSIRLGDVVVLAAAPYLRDGELHVSVFDVNNGRSWRVPVRDLEAATEPRASVLECDTDYDSLL